MNEIFEQIKKITAEQLDIDESEITLDTAFIDDLDADSLDIVELMMSLEEEFDLEISEEDAEKIVTVNDAVSYIIERQ